MKLEDIKDPIGLKLVLGPGVPSKAKPFSMQRDTLSVLIRSAHLIVQDGHVIKARLEDHRPIEAHDLEDAYVIEKIGEDEYEVYPPMT